MKARQARKICRRLFAAAEIGWDCFDRPKIVLTPWKRSTVKAAVTWFWSRHKPRQYDIAHSISKLESLCHGQRFPDMSATVWRMANEFKLGIAYGPPPILDWIPVVKFLDEVYTNLMRRMVL